MTKKQIKKLIKKGNSLNIQQAISKRWRLDNIKTFKPYNDN